MVMRIGVITMVMMMVRPEGCSVKGYVSYSLLFAGLSPLVGACPALAMAMRRPAARFKHFL